MKCILSLLLASLLLLTGACAEAAEPDWQAVAQNQLELFAGGDFEAMRDEMTDELADALTVDALKGTLDSLGAVEDWAFSGISEQQGFRIVCFSVNQGGANYQYRFVLDADARLAGWQIAPGASQAATSAPAADVYAEDVRLRPGEPDDTQAILTLPAAEGTFPAVILVQGSGPSDRDETVGAVAPFRDLAEMLTRRGIAVIRYDKRTYVYGQEIASSADFTAFTVEEETIQDAITAGRMLAEDPRIDASRIFVLGHSLGAMLAPRIVAESDGLFCGMILACGTNRSLLEIMLRQNEDAIAALPEDQQAAYQPMLAEARAQLKQLPSLDGDAARALTILGQPGYYFWDMVQKPTAAEYLAQLQLPALIINGSRDFQINEEEGRQTWESVLPMDAPWLKTLWADVNHMLMKPEVDASAAGTTMEYYVPCTVDAETVSVIADFILTTEETNP